MRARTIGITVLATALAARALHVMFIRGHPFWELADYWTASDMYQYAAWARHLAAGDWLDADTFRAWFDWQQGIARKEVWESWFGAHVYYQPPLYTYFLALVLRAAGSLEVARYLQGACGALNAVIVALCARRLGGAAAGWTAGMSAALYAPWILYDTELLRGTATLATQGGLLLCLLSWQAAPAGRGRRARAALSGGMFGLAWCTDPVIVPFAPLACAWMAWAARDQEAGGRARIEPVALFVAGTLAALAPLAARNLAVGAPPLSMTTRAPLGFVMGNAPDASPAGANIPPSTGLILDRSGYRMGATIRETLRLYDGHYGRLIAHQAAKMKALWGAYEIPDNPNFYYAARISPVVGWGLRFIPVAAVGLVGLALSLHRARREPVALLVPLFLAASVALFLMAHVVSRYRQPMAMALMILAGGAVGWALRRGWRARLAVVTAACLVGCLLPRAPAPGYGYDRPAEFLMVASIHAMHGRPGDAVSEIGRALDVMRQDPAYRPAVPLLLYERGLYEGEAGRPDDAAASFREALKENPAFEPAARALRESGR